MNVAQQRVAYTDERLRSLADAVSKDLGSDYERIFRKDTTIYVVGSGGRGEMSVASDVDLFVARIDREPADVDSLAIRQSVARALYALGLPDASQGGMFLAMHTADSMCRRLGTAEDDASNALTARMLLLLESRPLVNEPAYEELIKRVLEKYWQDFSVHKDDYQPYVLVNDVIRYWRILLLNYVAKLAEKERELKPDDIDADRGIRSYKLRFSRCITCFSTLAKLLALTGEGAVTLDDALTTTRERPQDRFRSCATLVPEVRGLVDDLLERYETFLTTMDTPKSELKASFRDHAFRSTRLEEGAAFGERVFELMKALGEGRRRKQLFRHMVV